MFGSFSEGNQPLALFTLRFYAKRWPKFSHISKYNPVILKIWSINLFQILIIRRPFYREHFKQEKSGRNHHWLFCNRPFFTMYFFVLVAMNHQKYPPIKVFSYEFSCTDNFFTIFFFKKNFDHSYRLTVSKKNSSWLVLYFMDAVTSCYYDCIVPP